MSFTATVSPAANYLTTAESGAYDEEITVSLPQQGAIAKIDVYFLTDSTGSMTPIINAVRNGASDILNGLLAKAHEVAADLHFGVGNYQDFDTIAPPGSVFRHQQSLTTNTDAVTTAIGSWAVAGGGDAAEGQFYALDQLAQTPNGSIGWRSDAKRIVIWFGDAPGHDPICPAISGLSYDITEQSVTAKLTGEEIIVLAISTSPGVGLNADPIPHSRGGDYESLCGTVGGSAGQGSRIAMATGGEFADNINAATIVETILRLGGAEVARIGNVSLVADEQITPFVTTITPGHGHGPLAASDPHDVDFDVSFVGLSITGGPPSTTEPVTVNGTLDVRADGVTVGRKTVQITVPDLAGKYKIQSKVNGLFLQLKAPANWDGPAGAAHVVDQGTARVDGDATSQHWELIPVPGGGYQINNLYPRGSGLGVGRFLEVPGGVARDEDESGDPIGLVSRGGPPGVNHQWRFIPVGADGDGVIYRIETFLNFDRDNYYTSYVIDASLNHGQDNPVFLHHYWGNYPTFVKNHGQHWRLLLVP